MHNLEHTVFINITIPTKHWSVLHPPEQSFLCQDTTQIKHTGQQSQEIKQTEAKNDDWDFDKQGTYYNVNNIFYIHNDEWNS